MVNLCTCRCLALLGKVEVRGQGWRRSAQSSVDLRLNSACEAWGPVLQAEGTNDENTVLGRKEYK